MSDEKKTCESCEWFYGEKNGIIDCYVFGDVHRETLILDPDCERYSRSDESQKGNIER